MQEHGLKISELVTLFNLEVLNRGSDYDTALLTITDVNRPGLQFHSFYDYFDPRRLQVLGKAEITYLKGLTTEQRRKCFDDLFLYDIPALVISRGLDCFPECLESARVHERTLLRTEETTVEFTSHTIEYLNRVLAPCVTRHGVLLDISGEGVMITGDSGIGKSESAIELIMRGHRLVADDAVEIRRISNQLIGTAPEVIRHYIELRGIGVIDVRQLFGPPGTGKTMLAKAVAGEANVPFFSISGSDFVEMFVGMGASKVRDLFKQAKEKAPCIVFIDEIDAIGQKRNSGAYGGNDEREQTLNQLLTEMDGFEGNTGVIILAATNRPESLDPALTRPGRFDRRVPVELPDLQGREDILKVHAKKIKVAEDVDWGKVARMASGASGAELANIVNEAALRAVRDGRRFAAQADLEESIEVVIAGYQKKNAILTDQEKKVVAYHEIGHALVAAKQTNSAPVQKITIVPRTSGALGYTMQVEEGNHYLMSQEELENKIATLTGGRAAEELVFHSASTGASNDIEQATKLARAMITRYGMSPDFDMVALETVQNQYLGGDASLACSAETAAEIDRQVVELVKRQHEKANRILSENREKLDELARYLYEKETITGDEFMEILNQ